MLALNAETDWCHISKHVWSDNELLVSSRGRPYTQRLNKTPLIMVLYSKAAHNSLDR
jgi:hypothetical protein